MGINPYNTLQEMKIEEQVLFSPLTPIILYIKIKIMQINPKNTVQQIWIREQVRFLQINPTANMNPRTSKILANEPHRILYSKYESENKWDSR